MGLNIIKIYTIGFTKKDAKQFFSLLINSNVKRLIDVRLNNSSQLAGFAKGRDLSFFLKEICDCEYVYKPEFSPTKELLDDYKKGVVPWEQYELEFGSILNERRIENLISEDVADQCCFLCSEHTADKCHRRLVAEYLQIKWGNVEIEHL